MLYELNKLVHIETFPFEFLKSTLKLASSQNNLLNFFILLNS